MLGCTISMTQVLYRNPSLYTPTLANRRLTQPVFFIVPGS
jgi:hypothetical protein